MVAIGLCVFFFGAIAFVSMRHFKGDSKSLGNTLIRIISAFCFVVLLYNSVGSYPPPLPNSLASALLSATGFLVFLPAVRETRHKNFGVAFSSDKSSELVASGIYGTVRNPLYLSYILFWCSWVPLTDISAFSIFTALGFVVTYYVAVRQEERQLTEEFGEAFISYMGQTGRFLPKLFA